MTAEMYNQSVFLVLKAAYLYYIDNKSQNEIAKQLKISVATVSRLLKRAKKVMSSDKPCSSRHVHPENRSCFSVW